MDESLVGAVAMLIAMVMLLAITLFATLIGFRFVCLITRFLARSVQNGTLGRDIIRMAWHGFCAVSFVAFLTHLFRAFSL